MPERPTPALAGDGTGVPPAVGHARRLWYLQLVTRCGSFAAAARAAGVTQPAITLALQGLQEDLGIALFEVVGRRRVPTPQAVRIANGIADANDRIDALVQGARPAKKPPQGAQEPVLQVGMLPGTARTYGAAIAQAWCARHPRGRLEIRLEASTMLLDALRADDLDLAILPRPRHLDVTGMSVDVLRSSRPVICARKGHPMASAQTLADLQGAHWAATGLLPKGSEVIEEAYRVRGMPAPHMAAYCPDVVTLLQMVVHSELLCVVSHPELIDSGLRRLVEPVRILDNLPRLETCLFARTGRRVRHREEVEAVRQALQDVTAP